MRRTARDSVAGSFGGGAWRERRWPSHPSDADQRKRRQKRKAKAGERRRRQRKQEKRHAARIARAEQAAPAAVAWVAARKSVVAVAAGAAAAAGPFDVTLGFGAVLEAVPGVEAGADYETGPVAGAAREGLRGVAMMGKEG